MDEERKLQISLKKRQEELRHEEEIVQSAVFQEELTEAAHDAFEKERVSVGQHRATRGWRSPVRMEQGESLWDG